MARNHSSQGVTLVEVLIALATIALLVAGASGLLLSASGAIRMARLETSATFLAGQKVEQLRTAADPALSRTGQDYFTSDLATTASASALFTRRWTVTPEWGGSEDSGVVVEVLARGVGRVAELHAVVHRAPGAGGSEAP